MSKQTNTPKVNLSAALGLFFFAWGTIVFVSFLFNWLEYKAFENGRLIEATIANSHQNETGEWFVSVTFRADGEEKNVVLESLPSEIAPTLVEGDKVVALQMENSPSRLILADNLPDVRPDLAGGLAVTMVPMFLGVGAMAYRPVLRRRGWDEERLRGLDGRLFGIMVGLLFLFVALGGAISAFGEMRNKPVALILTLCVVGLVGLFGALFISSSFRKNSS